jgi:photosystem II stability/assembly factor-like uncharacterized protein
VFLAIPLALFLVATTGLAQLSRETQPSGTTENLRGVSAVSQQIAWASGSHGTYLRTTDAGRTWLAAQVPGAYALDFRGLIAFSADEAFLMSSGPGDQSRIYYTSDGGQHWQLQFTAANPKSFFDSIAFWDRTHGVVLGDPIPDEKGQLKFQLLRTADGQSWIPIPSVNLPPAQEGEAAFAASNTSLAILNKATPAWKSGASGPRQSPERDEVSAPDSNLWFATGGSAARVFHSSDRGQTWEVFNTPITHGPDSAGIFSIAFRDPLHGVIVGGDYKHPDRDGPNLAFTRDGGRSWTVSAIYPQSYYSAVAYDRSSLTPAAATKDDNQAGIRIFIASPKFILDFHPPADPSRISPPRKSTIRFNAIAPYPAGGALFVGPRGSIATLP